MVRSAARRRVRAVAVREGKGGGGLREEIRVLSQVWDGCGRDWDKRECRRVGWRSGILLGVVGVGDVGCLPRYVSWCVLWSCGMFVGEKMMR